MISKTEEERIRYEMRTKAMRDYASTIEAARDEGFEKGEQRGEQKGEQRGLQKGIWLGRLQDLQGLLGETVSPFEELQTWEVDRLKKMVDSLQARLRERT